jgi:hypothetical protein
MSKLRKIIRKMRMKKDEGNFEKDEKAEIAEMLMDDMMMTR